MSERTFEKRVVKQAVKEIEPSVVDEEIKKVSPNLIEHLDAWLDPKESLTEREIEKYFFHTSLEILNLKEFLPHRKKLYQKEFDRLMKKIKSISN